MGLESMQHLEDMIAYKCREIIKKELKFQLSAVRYGQRGKQIKLRVFLGADHFQDVKLDIQDLIER